MYSANELFDQHSGGSGAENDYTHTDEMYINFVDADGDALTVTKAFDSYTVSITHTHMTLTQGTAAPHMAILLQQSKKPIAMMAVSGG